MSACTVCGRTFNSAKALHAHCRGRADHPFCEDCKRLFVNSQALVQHLENSPAHRDSSSESETPESESEDEDESFECTDCDRVFISANALHAHCRDKSDHAYCERCERLFNTFEALNQHEENSFVHRDSPSDSESESESESDDPFSEEEDDEDDERYCRGCNRWFGNNASLLQHLAASSSHNWCFVCSRDFASQSALSQHNNSRVHKPSNILCPLCKSGFKLPSAIAHHIESGGCHKKIDRHRVTAAVHSLDINPAISISRRIEGPSQAVITYSATERAYNGTAYECYLCHRSFRTLPSLNTHLRSAAHDADEFKCPAKKCGSKFKLISALIQHIESESCGLARFKEVEEYAADLTSRFSRLLKI